MRWNVSHNSGFLFSLQIATVALEAIAARAEGEGQ
jgi:hypothetical protein